MIRTVSIAITLFFGLAFCEAAEPDLTLSISIPHTLNEPGVLHWGLRNEPPRFHVILTNDSLLDIRILGERSADGALSFELTDENGRTWSAHKTQNITVSFPPAFATLKPRESYVFDVDYANRTVWGDNFWLPPGHPSGRVTLKAVYAVNAGYESKEFGIWTGRITSKPVDCVIK